MMIEAGLLAVITEAGLASMWKKLPKTVKDFMIKHPLLTDLFMLFGTYAFLGFTILAHMAGGLIVLFTTCMLYIAAHPDDFMYLYDAQKAISEWVVNLQKSLNERGKQYRAEKARKEAVTA